MKTMTCKQMGGPCNTPIKGSTFDEMMQNGEKHITSMKDKDPEHKKAYDMMATLSQNPAANNKWTDDMMAKFNALPEDNK